MFLATASQSLHRAKGKGWKPESCTWSIIKSCTRTVPRSDHQGPASPGHKENRENAGSQGKPVVRTSPVLLCLGTLASLSCHCNTISHPQLSWIPGMSRVLSLGNLPPSNWGQMCPQIYPWQEGSLQANSSSTSGWWRRMNLMPFTHALAAEHDQRWP